MTVGNFGQITPLQMGIFMLCGYRLTRERGMTEMLKSEKSLDAVETLIEGRRILRKVTGQDFCYSLSKWHDFLRTDEKTVKSYTRQITWRGVERAVLAELQNPDRERLEALAEQQA